MKAVALNLVKFFEDESCGQCTPCRVGTEKAVKLMEQGPWNPELLTELSDLDARRLDLRAWPGRAEPAVVRAEIFPRGTDQAAGTIGEREAAMSDKTNDTKPNTFFIDDREIDIRPGETIFRAARRLDIKLPHLCYSPKPGYRPDGNCRVCMVEIEGERVLAASCIRTPSPGMKVKTADRPRQDRAPHGRRAADDRPAGRRRTRMIRIPSSGRSPSARRSSPAASPSASRSRCRSPTAAIVAMAVNLDACIHCNLCVRACREVQVNDVIGMAGRGHLEKIVFDFDDPMGASTCVACGECVQACPTGALMPATLVDDEQRLHRASPTARSTACAPIAASAASSPITSRTTSSLYVTRQERPGEREPAVRQGPLRLRLRAQSAAPHQADDPQGRRAEGAARVHRSVESVDAFPRSHLGRGARPRRLRPQDHPRPRRPEGARRLRLGQGLERRGLSVPEARARRLRHQQRRPLHAALPRLVGRGAARRRRLGRGVGDLQRGEELRRHHRDRRQPDREPSGRRDLLQAGGQARRQADRDGPARAGAQAPRLAA